MRRDRGHRSLRACPSAVFRAAGRLARVLALAAGLLILPLPCADDLLVDTGAAADECASAGLSPDAHRDAPSPGDASCCPCACHVGIAPGPAIAQLPEPERGALPTSLLATVLDPVSTPITHPPLG